jgi:hypothetical protein
MLKKKKNPVISCYTESASNWYNSGFKKNQSRLKTTRSSFPGVELSSKSKNSKMCDDGSFLLLVGIEPVPLAHILRSFFTYGKNAKLYF